MEAFKIENYERVNGLGTFLPFRHLSQEEAEHIDETLRKILNLPDKIDPRSMSRAIRDASILVDSVNADSDCFDLQQVLIKLKFDITETVYLNWYRYNTDEIKTRDLIANFSDIWYPSTDDLDIIDIRMQWLIFIEHSGAVMALNLATR